MSRQHTLQFEPPLRGAPPAPPAQGSSIAVDLAGEPVRLLAERALFWPRMRAVLIADLHLGKAAAFRACGVPLPRGSTAADLARLGRVLQATRAEQLYVLGDFFHAAHGRVDALHEAFFGWRRRHAHLAITVVRGNHDLHAGAPPATWRIAVVAEAMRCSPFVFAHEPVTRPDGYTVGGHLHPGVRLAARDGDSARLPCFVLGERRAILPAFTRFSGLAVVRRQRGDRIVAVAGERVFALPA